MAPPRRPPPPPPPPIGVAELLTPLLSGCGVCGGALAVAVLLVHSGSGEGGGGGRPCHPSSSHAAVLWPRSQDHCLSSPPPLFRQRAVGRGRRGGGGGGFFCVHCGTVPARFHGDWGEEGFAACARGAARVIILRRTPGSQRSIPTQPRLATLFAARSCQLLAPLAHPYFLYSLADVRPSRRLVSSLPASL